MNTRKECPIPYLDRLDRIRVETVGSRAELAKKMNVDWDDGYWTKEKLDDIFEGNHEPKVSTVAKIALSLGQKFPYPSEFVPRRNGDE